MAQRRPRPPLTAREIAAWGAGRRCGASGHFVVDETVERPEAITVLLLPAEQSLREVTPPDEWWQWWWRGYHVGRAERL